MTRRLAPWIARRLRFLADRIDHAGAPKAMHVRFTFEDHVGIVFRDDGRGCRLWYYGDADYERAHDESGPVTGRNSTAWLPQRPGQARFTFEMPSEQDMRRSRRELLEYTDRNGGLMSPAARAELDRMRAETGEQ